MFGIPRLAYAPEGGWVTDGWPTQRSVRCVGLLTLGAGAPYLPQLADVGLLTLVLTLSLTTSKLPHPAHRRFRHYAPNQPTVPVALPCSLSLFKQKKLMMRRASALALAVLFLSLFGSAQSRPLLKIDGKIAAPLTIPPEDGAKLRRAASAWSPPSPSSQ
jgi:hypothetical protein